MALPLFALLALTVLRPPAPAPLRCVIFGGGPEPTHNQVAIESNVRYVHSLLSSNVDRTVLFADGQANTSTVQFLDTRTEAQKAIRHLFGDGPAPARGEPFLQYRKSNVPRRDGPTNAATIRGVFDKLAAEGENAPPLLLYFTGHGSPGNRTLENNRYDLWAGGALTTTDLAAQLGKLPAQRPVTIVMVQCFSGAFGNLLFEGGEPGAELTDHPLCGFFATVKERVAAGCTPEVEEEDYHDFTSYFFAALTGKDRLGRKVAPPDYNHDGKVGMDEALAWTQVNEESIDVPVATSDVFLRRFVPTTSDKSTLDVPWETVRQGASVAQRAALEGLSEKLGLTDSERVRTAYAHFDELQRRKLATRTSEGTRFSREIRDRYEGARQKLFERFASLGDQKATVEEWKSAVARAIRYLESNPRELSEVTRLRTEMETLTDRDYKKDIEDARWFRFVRIAKSVVLEQKLRQAQDKTRIAQLEALRTLESQNPLR